MLVVKIFMSCGRPVVYEFDVDKEGNEKLVKHTRCRHRKEANELKAQVLLRDKINRIGLHKFSLFATQQIKCRRLFIDGYTETEISRILGCNYQQVANSLEDIKEP
jgi:hypothetical protein